MTDLIQQAEAMEANAAKTAALQAECASHQRIADLCMDAARMSCAERDEARAECAMLRAFHDAWADRCAHIFMVGGDELLDLYNAAHKAALRGKESK